MKENSRIKPIERATLRTWDEWLAFMESIKASELEHHRIATKVLEELDGKIESPAWWAQSVTVAYEQDISRRIPGQRPDGTFQTSVSKATKLSMGALMDKWVEFAAGDPDVLEMIAGEVRVSGTERRITWRTKGQNGSSINVLSQPKADGHASIVVQHIGMQTEDLNNEAKSMWSSILARFLAER